MIIIIYNIIIQLMAFFDNSQLFYNYLLDIYYYDSYIHTTVIQFDTPTQNTVIALVYRNAHTMIRPMTLSFICMITIVAVLKLFIIT